MKAIHKILVVRLSSIGDIILTTPLLRSVKNAFPHSSVTFVIKKQYSALLASSPYIDELIEFDQASGKKGLKEIRDQLTTRNFDLYLDIHKNWRSLYLRKGLPFVKTTTYSKLIFKRSMLIWFKINLYKTVKPVYERYFDTVKHLGLKYDGRGTEIRFPEGDLLKVKELLVKAGYTEGRPIVVICPSATYFNKRWKPDGFIETARFLLHEKGAFIVVHGGKEDRPLCSMISSSIGEGSLSMAGMLSLSESAALLSMARLAIANDSGLLHMAQSQKTPVVGIYGPTTRELGYFPVPENSTVIETSISCRPCTHNGLNYCPRKHFRCMNDIHADRVIDACLPYLQ